MLLRPRQKQFVERSLRALGEHGNTLGVAPTGAGKTIMLSATVGGRLAGSEKSWAGRVTFAMVPTLARAANLASMPALDLLVLDEAHHAAADSYRRIIDRALRRNP